MNKTRLEAFSDGVIAIIITIMVLELEVPHDPTWQSYVDKMPVFVSYVLSFVFVGEYWASHHHLFHKIKKINTTAIWLNMLSLFWLSLIPFATATMGENNFKSITVTIFALILALCVVSFLLLITQLHLLHGADSEFAASFRGVWKSSITIGCNLSAAAISSFGWPKLAFLLLALTAVAWFIPNSKTPFSCKE